MEDFGYFKCFLANPRSNENKRKPEMKETREVKRKRNACNIWAGVKVFPSLRTVNLCDLNVVFFR